MKNLKEILKMVTELRVKVYSGQSLEENEQSLYDIEHVIYKAMDDELKRMEEEGTR